MKEHIPILIEGSEVEKMSCFKFLGVKISEDLTSSQHINAVIKKAIQWQYFVRSIKKFGTATNALNNFYSCTMESIFTGCITV